MKTNRKRAARSVKRPEVQPKTYAWPIFTVRDDTPRQPPHGRMPDRDNGHDHHHDRDHDRHNGRDGRNGPNGHNGHNGPNGHNGRDRGPNGPNGHNGRDRQNGYGRPNGNTGRVETMTEILNALLTAEKVESALYARGLQSPALQGLPPDQFAYFQAGLSHELAHINVLTELGADVPYEEFFFPPGAFEDLSIYVNTLLTLETAGVSAYIQASYEFARMGRLDLSRLMDQIMGVEAEHRALLRDVLELVPAANLCFERAPNEPVTQILAALPAFLRPNQFDGSSVGPVSIPSPEQAAELIGPNGCPNPTPDL